MTQRKTILFVEDEDELLATVGLVLREKGYDVVAVKSAEDALKLLKKTSPDLILADIKLPGIDGLDFFQLVRRDEQTKRTPFIFLTAFNNLAAAVNAKKQGAADYITKPFEVEHLVERVRELLPT